jgi:predicted GNAT family acetyltransferase
MTEPGDAATTDPDVVVRDNPESRTYDAMVGDEIAGTLLYEFEGPRIVLTHTAVQPRYQHHGIASKLIPGALDDIRAKGKRVTVICPFVREYIDAHPAYADMVDDRFPGTATPK